MSDTFIKVISTVPESTLLLEKRDEISEVLDGKLDVEFELDEGIIFVDCGGNLEEIICPNCGEVIDFDWWGQAMDGYFESDCENPNFQVPCCGDIVSINDLIYNMPCGFARTAMVIENGDIDDETLGKLEKIVGEKLRVIKGRN